MQIDKKISKRSSYLQIWNIDKGHSMNSKKYVKLKENNKLSEFEYCLEVLISSWEQF